MSDKHNSRRGLFIILVLASLGASILTVVLTTIVSTSFVTDRPLSEAYGPVIQSLIISALLVMFGAVFSIGASILIARRIIRPIIELRDAANRFGRGDLSAKIEVTSDNEIGQLGRAFNNMADNLQASTAKLREEHAKMEASINSLAVGFLMIDNDGQAMVNAAARRILSVSADGSVNTEDNGRTWTLAELDARLGPSTALASSVHDAVVGLRPIEKKSVDYGSRIFHVRVAPIIGQAGDPLSTLGAAVLIEDITEEKVLERSKDEFFSIASHELRTPLTAIRGNASMMRDYFSYVLKDPQLKELVDDIHTSSVNLIDIVSDFLDVSRLEQGKMTFKMEAFAIDKIIESVSYEMRSALTEKHLYLKVLPKTLGKLPLVWADPARLKQVMYNLVGNAAKFTESGGVTLETKVEQGMMKVSITDTGRGIPPEGRALLFHKFQQAGNSLLTRDTSRGTGLGLYISKLFVEKMNGNLALEHSELGKGTTFSITIPLVAEGKAKA